MLGLLRKQGYLQQGGQGTLRRSRLRVALPRRHPPVWPSAYLRVVPLLLAPAGQTHWARLQIQGLVATAAVPAAAAAGVAPSAPPRCWQCSA